MLGQITVYHVTHIPDFKACRNTTSPWHLPIATRSTDKFNLAVVETQLFCRQIGLSSDIKHPLGIKRALFDQLPGFGSGIQIAFLR